MFAFPQRLWSSRTAVCLCAVVAVCLVSWQPLTGAEAKPWAEKDSRLATEYLNLLVEKPEYGRVLELLWDLYDKHEATAFLLENIATQAAAQPHPNVLLVHAHLQRKAGELMAARSRYMDVLKIEPANAAALRALTDLAVEEGDQTTALKHLDTLLATFPASDGQRVPLLLEQGRLWLAVGKPNEAAASWEQAMKQKPADEALAREVAQFLLSAGLVDKALTLYRQLATQTDPSKRLDALYDLSRLEEQADHFAEAAKALREGLALLHFRDWRYAQFFQRLVKLHERFGHLDALKADLQKAVGTQVPQEKALSDLARYSQQTVDSDERMRWLRALVKQFPEQIDYRWDLVAELLDHDGAVEAATLLDEVLKNDGTDSSSVVLLRALAHLRNGETDKALVRLKKILETQGGNADIEKQVLAFARAKSLDEIIETILKQRIARESERPEPVFELATFYRDRGRNKDLEKLFEAFTSPANGADRQRRLNDVSNFLASGTDSQSAEKAARLAAAQAGAGREELLRLGDVLVMRGNIPEALSVLERAWAMSDSAENRTDVDERIYSLLAGDQRQQQPAGAQPSSEFKLPAFFTGEGFGSDAPAGVKAESTPDALTHYALDLAAGVWRKGQDDLLLKTLPKPVQAALAKGLDKVAASAPTPTGERIFRAAWWCSRADQPDLAYSLIRRLIFDAQGHRTPSSVEVEKLLLDVALSERSVINNLLAVRQLKLLSTLDPASRSTYQLRLAELLGKMEVLASRQLRLPASTAITGPRAKSPAREDRNAKKGGLVEAVQILEQLAKEDPQNEAVLSALSEFYIEGGHREKAMALWEQSAKNAKGNATPLLERYAELLIAQRKYQEFVATQCQILDAESDVKRRRDYFQRALERLLWTEGQAVEASEADSKERLALMETALTERSRRNPFDGFWHEALAGIYEKQGDAAKAFAAMKQAYYTAPDTPFSLGQLRAAALRVGDLKSAIYFQKQIAATPGTTDEAGEWRQLVQLLEDDFRMKEADQARRRLESRFSQDATALEELAKYYAGSAQEEAARRVYEQVARVRAWDAKNLLRLALQQKDLGDLKAAQRTLLKLLNAAPLPASPGNLPPENLPWPLLDERKNSTTAVSGIITALDNVPGLEQPERDLLRRFFSLPRGEFTEVPEDPAHVRLRAVEELALMKSLPASLKLTPQEEIWASYHEAADADGPAFRKRLFEILGGPDRLEARFILVWLCVKSHGMQNALKWAREPDLAPAVTQHRKGLLQAVVNILADDSSFEFVTADVTALGEAGLLSNTELIDIARKFEGRRQYDLSIILASAAQRNAPSLGADYALFLARLAESAGDTDAQRQYLEQVLSKPLEAGRPDVFDPFVQSFATLWRSANTAEEREHLLTSSWERLQQLPGSGLGTLREGRLLGIVGATDVSASRLADYMGNGLLSARAFAEPLMGKLPPGAQPGPRIDEVNHLRGYWEDVREWEELIKQDGLAPQLLSVDATITRRNAGTSLGPRSNYEFGNWRNATFLRQLKVANYPERILLLREFIQTDDSVDNLLELGGLLESQGFARECLEIYRRLPDRAPTNTEYCEQIIRVCENAWDSHMVIPYIEKLLVAEPQLKPQGISEETLWEKHARFIARIHDTTRLRTLGFRANFNLKPLPGRVPEEVPYLKELALLLERQGDKPGALAAWEELHRLWSEDVQASLHRARLLGDQGNKTRALEALRVVPLSNLWNEHVRGVFALRSKLAAEAGLWEEVRDLMNIVAGGAAGASSSLNGGGGNSGSAFPGGKAGANVPQTASVLELGEILVAHQRTVEAQSLLLRAERAVKDDLNRFRLRLEQLILTAAAPAWNPVQDSPRIAALLRLDLEQEGTTESQQAMEALLEFIGREAAGPRASAWVQVLVQPGFPRKPLTSLALSGLAAHLNARQASLLPEPWTSSTAGQTSARELAVETLIKQGKPTWARDLAVAEKDQGPAASSMVDMAVSGPVMISVLAALGDRHGMDDLFARLVRMSFPGASDSVAHAEAFAKAGRKDLAGELYSLSVERVRATGASYPNLMESYARFLMHEHRFEEAETLLVKDYDGLNESLSGLLVDLYRGWKKLDRLEAELVKFHLPDGIWHEAVFLARQAKPQS